MNAFFMSYDFSDRVSGLFAECHGAKLYEIDYPTRVEDLIEDATKVMKKQDGVVTFQCFTGLETIDMLRLAEDYSMGERKMKAIYFGEYYTATPDLDINKKTVREYVYSAIEHFRSYPSEN